MGKGLALALHVLAIFAGVALGLKVGQMLFAGATTATPAATGG
jgi:hypothetical protein